MLETLKSMILTSLNSDSRMIGGQRCRRGRYGVTLAGLVVLATLASGAEPDLARRPPDAVPTVVESGSWTQTVALLQLPDDDGLREAVRLARNLNTNMPVGEARARLDQWIASKAAPLAQLSHLIQADQIEVPATMWLDNDYVDTLGHFIAAARLKIIVARGHAERGAHAEAAREFGAIFTLGRQIAAARGPIVANLIAMAIPPMALNGMRWLASQEGVPEEVLEDMLRHLPAPGTGDPDLVQTYRTELALAMVPQLRKIEALAASPTNPFPFSISRVLDVSHTLATAAAFFRRCERNALGTWPDRDRKISDDANRLVTLAPGECPDEMIQKIMWNTFLGQDPTEAKRWRRLQRFGLMPLLTLSPKSEERDAARQWLFMERRRKKQPNLLGNAIVASVLSLEPGLLRHSVETRTAVSLTRAYLAVLLVRRRTGAWPATLSDPGVTALLGQPPVDLFSMQPLRYSREKGMLWSVGKNELDDGGDAKEDIVIRLLEFQAP